MIVPVLLLLEESTAVVPEPSSKVQEAIGLVATCPSAVGRDPSRQIEAAAMKSADTRAWWRHSRAELRGCFISTYLKTIACSADNSQRGNLSFHIQIVS